jgi:hypothetical protein
MLACTKDHLEPTWQLIFDDDFCLSLIAASSSFPIFNPALPEAT